VGDKVPLGRRSNAALDNLHIAREQVVFELKPDAEGKILICMTNVGAAAGRAGEGVGCGVGRAQGD
jgi:hypothetical protein